MADAFNLNAIWRQFSMTGNETLTLSAYNGSAALVMFKKGSESRKPTVKFNISSAMAIAIKERLERLLDDPPGTRVPLVQQTFNKDARTYEVNTQFVFVKDEHSCYSIEVMNRYIATPVKFNLRCPNTFSFGQELLSDETKSAYALKDLIKLFDETIHLAMMLSRYGMENTRRGGKSDGNNSGYQRNNGGGSRDPFSVNIKLLK